MKNKFKFYLIQSECYVYAGKKIVELDFTSLGTQKKYIYKT